MEGEDSNFPDSDLGDDCEEFIETLEHNHAEATVRQYGHVLKHFCQWRE
jgi:hypothetical protein